MRKYLKKVKEGLVDINCQTESSRRECDGRALRQVQARVSQKSPDGCVVRRIWGEQGTGDQRLQERLSALGSRGER